MTLIDPVRIMTRAALALKELQTSEAWQAALEGASLTPSPLLVHSIAAVVEPRAARPARLPDYYIVSIARESGTTGRFAHDAETGELLEAEGVRKAGAYLTSYVDAPDIVRSRWPPPPGAAKTPLTADVVWKPCRESTSRFAPFWRFNVEGRTVYVRADGVLFTELTTSGRG